MLQYFCYSVICEAIPEGLFAAKPDFLYWFFECKTKVQKNNPFSVSHYFEGNLVWSSTLGVNQFRVRLGFSILKLLVILVVYDLISDRKSRVYL